jgi:DNA-binding IclR family transcriptional regulator
MQSPLGTQLSNNGRLDERRTSLAEQPAKTFPTVKAVAILEAMATARRPLGVSELGALLGLPKPTAHRIVRMLESEGLLQREPGSRRFVPGARMVQLGLGIVAASMLRAPRHAILEALSQKIGETCNFGVMTGSHVVYLDRVESAWPFGLRFEPGSRVPLHCTSMGKLFLSQLPAKKRALLLRSIPLYRYTETPLRMPQTWRPCSIRSEQPRFRLTIRNFWLGLYAWPFRCARRSGSGSLHSRSPRHLHVCR